MKFSERLIKEAHEFVLLKMKLRKRASSDLSKAWITINAIESGYEVNIDAIKELKRLRFKDSDLDRFWDNNFVELNAILTGENV
jgi:hypothetical protein